MEPNILNIKWPKRQNIAIIINETKTDLNATFFIILLSAAPTIAKKTGVFPIGLSIAKKPIKTVMTYNK